MSALASVFQDKTSATPYVKDGDFIWNFRLLNDVIDAVCDVGLYESKDEQKPGAWAIVAAASALNYVARQDRDSVEIEPYSGELSLIWRAGREKRVKAMFGHEKNSYSVYYERLVGGLVVERHLERNADHAYLTGRLAWLHT